jgi:hypothetical protein
VAQVVKAQLRQTCAAQCAPQNIPQQFVGLERAAIPAHVRLPWEHVSGGFAQLSRVGFGLGFAFPTGGKCIVGALASGAAVFKLSADGAGLCLASIPVPLDEAE